MDFPRHDSDTAPPASREALARVAEDFGTIPEAYAVFAESPVAIRCYLETSRILKECGRLTPRQQQLVMLAVSVETASDYCVAAHCRAARSAGVEVGSIDRLRDGKLPDEPSDAELVRFALAIWKSGGHPADADRAAFTEAGFGAAEALELIVLVSLKVLGGFANRLAGTPLDACMEEHRWQAPSN